MNDLERDLEQLVAALAVPEPPDLVGPVMQRLDARPRHHRLVVAAAAAMVLTLVAAMALPGPRRAIADLLGVGSVEVVLADRLPRVAAALELGEQVDAAPISVSLPAALGPAEAVFVDAAGIVTFVWPSSDRLPETSTPGVGAIVSAVSGSLDAGLQKTAGPGSVVEVVLVGGRPALWIEGEHTIAVRRSGAPIFDTVRLADNTVVWQSGDLTLRFESRLDRDDAVAIAEAMTNGNG